MSSRNVNCGFVTIGRFVGRSEHAPNVGAHIQPVINSIDAPLESCGDRTSEEDAKQSRISPPPLGVPRLLGDRTLIIHCARTLKADTDKTRTQKVRQEPKNAGEPIRPRDFGGSCA